MVAVAEWLYSNNRDFFSCSRRLLAGRCQRGKTLPRSTSAGKNYNRADGGKMTHTQFRKTVTPLFNCQFVARLTRSRESRPGYHASMCLLSNRTAIGAWHTSVKKRRDFDSSGTKKNFYSRRGRGPREFTWREKREKYRGVRGKLTTAKSWSMPKGAFVCRITRGLHQRKSRRLVGAGFYRAELLRFSGATFFFRRMPFVTSEKRPARTGRVIGC